ncbi:YIP1 family protein [Geothrix sp. 21YS21S-4]|uniref:YIP1 family protein n=1 Tax=Geothrix sp. 21YS21S-4 TaxID=3068889 RepID=UPI0027BAA2C7|nr:YIP1 family protein [Geothrix sp. 21YS21S-4]
MSEIPGPHDAPPPAIPLDEPLSIPPIVPPEPPLPPPSPAPVPFEDPERYGGFWSRVGAMFQMVFRNPMELFERVPAGEGFGAPWRFLLLLSVPAFFIVAGLFFFMGLGIAVAALEHTGRADGRAVAAAMPAIFGILLALLPLVSFLGMLIGGAFHHAFLWMWGGLKPGAGVNQSIRAYGYASAFIQLGALIPYLGFLAQIAGMVVLGMGLARLHKTDTWRGVCAALTPFVLLCCCGIGTLGAVTALIAAGRH